MEYFHKGLNLSNLGDEEVIILESCSEDERDHIGPSDDLKDDFFYMYLPIIQDLGLIILFTIFECEVIKIINIVCSQISPDGWVFITAFEILYRDFMVSPTMSLFLSFYNTKTSRNGGWVTLGDLSGRVLFTIYLRNYKN